MRENEIKWNTAWSAEKAPSKINVIRYVMRKKQKNKNEWYNLGFFPAD